MKCTIITSGQQVTFFILIHFVTYGHCVLCFGPENKVGRFITFHNTPNGTLSYLSTHLSTSPNHPSTPQPSISLYIRQSIYLPQPCIHPSIHPFTHPPPSYSSIRPSNHPLIRPSVHPIFQWSTSYSFSVTFYHSCHFIASLAVTLFCFITTLSTAFSHFTLVHCLPPSHAKAICYPPRTLHVHTISAYYFSFFTKNCVIPTFSLMTSFLTFNSLRHPRRSSGEIHFCTYEFFLELVIQCSNFPAIP